MRTFLIGLGIVVVVIIVYFIWADYRSRKETEKITKQSAPSGAGVGGKKKNTALDWISTLIPVVAGTIDTILSKPKPEEEDEEVKELAPSYEDLIAQGELDYPAYG